MTYTNYQLKSVIEQFLEKNPKIHIKGWKSATKKKLLEIMKFYKINTYHYKIPRENPNPPKKTIQNVLKKYGKKAYTPEEQQEYIIEDKKHRNAFKALGEYVNKEGEIDKIKLQIQQILNDTNVVEYINRYKQKYMKYKQKYLKLKNNIN